MRGKRTISTKTRVIKTLLWIFLVLMIVVVAAAGTAFWYVTDKIGGISNVKLNTDELAVSENDNLDKYRNIAIFGIDSRDDDYGKGNRSDCIIIASINNETNAVKLISVYRDTYVQIAGRGLDKITHAYSYGEAPLALKTLNENLDLNITEFVTVNFDAVVEIVDAIGGIRMKITDAEVKYINDYIDGTSKATGKKSEHITKAGTYNLDGVQAVAYSRIRYTAGGDHKRTERMRDVITAVIAKVKTKSITEITKIANSLLTKVSKEKLVYTNIDLQEMLSMLPVLSNFTVAESAGWPYNNKGAMINNISYGVPVTLESNVEKLHKEVFEDEDYEVPQSVKEISDKIVKKSGYSK